jgi:Pyruvate/2-oxoacid:ferredoxin oxidoreductase delta subunit
MAGQSEVFNQLAEKYGVPGSERFIKVLDAMITPEEGEILLALWTPVTFQELAGKLNMEENHIRNKLAVMLENRLITKRKETYFAPTALIPLCHQTVNMSAITDRLWTDFFFEEWRYVIAKVQHDNRLTKGATFHRILPALQALAMSPHIPPEDILWYENLDAALKRANQIVSVRCVCRAQYHKCNNKEELCMHLTLNDGFSPPMDRWTDLKHYTYQEALDELYAAEDAGMCHLCQNFPRLEETCNCCDDCCRVINPLINCQEDYDIADPHKSRFQASINQDACNGCQTCMERCMFKAVEMVKTENQKKLKARIIAKKCMGCGLCVYTCPQKAIRFDIVRPPNFIPFDNPFHKGRLGVG